MDRKLSYADIEKKLDAITLDIERNQWDKLSDKFSEIRNIKKKIDLDNQNKTKETDQKLLKQKESILLKIEQLEKKITIWKENQQKKINSLKNKENHLNGYKKQPSRSYYIDKSE